MTEEQFNALAKFEDLFDRVSKRQYVGYPGLASLQLMLAVVQENRPRYRPNLGCSSCVRTLVLETAGLYKTEKARREQEAAANPAPSPKKTTRKKKADA